MLCASESTVYRVEGGRSTSGGLKLSDFLALVEASWEGMLLTDIPGAYHSKHGVWPDEATLEALERLREMGCVTREGNRVKATE
mmetsp:Transcript_474/g.1563  ORF Transcript_474/g.1563 Transcript_474/m.1563 type:complete len:84 (-) Transcript_474:247-498(-)